MKHTTRTALLRTCLIVTPLALLAGCPLDASVLEPLPDVAGTYWVEYGDGELAVFELPEYRGEEGTWHLLATEQPSWYTGPALYEVGEDGSWVRLTTDPGLTLDDIIQLYDPAPRVDEAE